MTLTSAAPTTFVGHWIDGALSAQFLAEVRRLLEAPVGLLLG